MKLDLRNNKTNTEEKAEGEETAMRLGTRNYSHCSTGQYRQVKKIQQTVTLKHRHISPAYVNTRLCAVVK